MASSSSRTQQRHAAYDTSGLETALKSNRTLQRTLAKELGKIARRKAESRERAALISQDLVTLLETKQPPELAKQFRGDPYRWTGEKYFATKKPRDKPEPNVDTLRRRNLESETFLCHLQPAWTKKEARTLSGIIENQLEQKQGPSAANTSEPSTSGQKPAIDFAKVAEELDGKTKKKARHFSRSPEGCKILYESMKQSPPFSKEESLRIAEMVHAARQKNELPDWTTIAASLKDRTAWDCLVAFQTQIEPVHTKPWTPEEDELLFKYFAAAGPQFMLDRNVVQRLTSSKSLLPNKTRKQILFRTAGSLLNPKLKHDEWSKDEERRLVIMMKMYRDWSDRILFMASTHFPRGNKSVVDKWQRALNPAYLARPFSKEEDKALMDVVRSLGNNVGWAKLSEQYFPDRHPHRLMVRWADLASDKDILEREGDILAKPRGKRKSDVRSSLSSDDLVVQVVKTPRR